MQVAIIHIYKYIFIDIISKYSIHKLYMYIYIHTYIYVFLLIDIDKQREIHHI